MAPNPHVSAKPSDSGLRAALHPLALLTISDYITKHTLRGLEQPIAGALLGQQAGREITIEHAYDVQLQTSGPASLTEDDEPPSWKIHDDFFQRRLQAYRDVLTKPPLDLVGWWTVGPAAVGPSEQVMALHQHVLQHYNEGALLLVFHPEGVGEAGKDGSAAPGVRLPLTIYESVLEQSKEDDGAMDVGTEGDAGGGGGGGEKLVVRLRELPYDVATGEAEMIGVDHVARGGGNASVQAQDVGTSRAQTNGAGGQTISKSARTAKTSDSSFNAEEEEMLSFLTARANAIRILQSRIALLKSRLAAVPKSYLTDASVPVSATGGTEIPHQLLRATLSLAARLALVSASNPKALTTEHEAQSADAAIVGLLSALGRSTQQAKELGGKFAMREATKRGTAGRFGGGGGSGTDIIMDNEPGEIQLLTDPGGNSMEF